MPFKEFLKTKDTARLVALWNEFSESSSYEPIFVGGLEELGAELFHNRPVEFARAVYFGDVGNWADDYAYFDAYGNIVSFNYWDDVQSPIDLEELAFWLEESEHEIFVAWEEGGK